MTDFSTLTLASYEAMTNAELDAMTAELHSRDLTFAEFRTLSRLAPLLRRRRDRLDAELLAKEIELDAWITLLANRVLADATGVLACDGRTRKETP